MKIKVDMLINPELKDYLLTQEGITDAFIDYNNYYVELDIKYNKKTNPIIIGEYIKLFENKKYLDIVEFTKDCEGELNTLEYNVDDICCQNCYLSLMTNLYENEKIISVKSNYDFKNNQDVKFNITYMSDYSEEKVIEILNK